MCWCMHMYVVVNKRIHFSNNVLFYIQLLKLSDSSLDAPSWLKSYQQGIAVARLGLLTYCQVSVEHTHTAGVMDAKWLLGRVGKSGQSCCVARASPGRVMPDPHSTSTDL